MLEVEQYIIGKLTAYSALTSLVPATSMFVGPVDITMESQASLLYPSIVVWQISESVRTVPLNTRDTVVQIDLWSRNSQLEIENIYEQMLLALNYQSGDQSTAHVFWQRLNGATDMPDSDSTRRVWHRACSFVVWSIKP